MAPPPQRVFLVGPPGAPMLSGVLAVFDDKGVARAHSAGGGRRVTRACVHPRVLPARTGRQSAGDLPRGVLAPEGSLYAVGPSTGFPLSFYHTVHDAIVASVTMNEDPCRRGAEVAPRLVRLNEFHAGGLPFAPVDVADACGRFPDLAEATAGIRADAAARLKAEKDAAEAFARAAAEATEAVRGPWRARLAAELLAAGNIPDAKARAARRAQARRAAKREADELVAALAAADPRHLNVAGAAARAEAAMAATFDYSLPRAVRC